MILTQVLLFARISIVKWAMLKGTPLPAERRSDRPRSLLRTLAPLQLLGRARRPPSRRLMRPCLPLQARARLCEPRALVAPVNDLRGLRERARKGGYGMLEQNGLSQNGLSQNGYGAAGNYFWAVPYHTG